jgi:hypothetical protein
MLEIFMHFFDKYIFVFSKMFNADTEYYQEHLWRISSELDKFRINQKLFSENKPSKILQKFEKLSIFVFSEITFMADFIQIQQVEK